MTSGDRSDFTADERELRQRLARNSEQRREIIQSSLHRAGSGASWQLEDLDAEDADIRRQLGIDPPGPEPVRKSSLTGWILLGSAVVLVFVVIAVASGL